jgi:hypothetical protein
VGSGRCTTACSGETRDTYRFSAASRQARLLVVGDNGDGQSTLSCIAHLLPRAMGFTQPSAEEEDLIRFLSPGRESLKEAAARVGITILDLEKLQT